MDSVKEENDLYSLLGITRSATLKQIQNAFHNASLEFHPDRVETELQADAAKMFVRLKRAYDILSDPDKRALYDAVGERAFQMGGMQIVAARCKTPAEILSDFYQEEERRREATFQAGINQKVQVIAVTDLSNFIDNEGQFQPDTISLQSVFVSNSSDLLLPQYENARFRLGYAVQIKDNMSGSCTIKPGLRFLKKMLNFGGCLILGVGTGVNGIEADVLEIGRMVECRFKLLSSPSGYAPSIRLSNNMHRIGSIGSAILSGQCALKVSKWSSLTYTLNFVRDRAFGAIGIELWRSAIGAHLTAGYKDEEKVGAASISLSPVSVALKLRGENMRGTYTRVTFDVTIEPDQVSVILGAIRGSVSYQFPIILSSEPSRASVFYSLVLVAASYYASRKVFQKEWIESKFDGKGKTKEEAEREQQIEPRYFRQIYARNEPYKIEDWCIAMTTIPYLLFQFQLAIFTQK
ncbi:hypothetical protein ACOME3_003559 [Neoechinorhynchus agilis]